jgi:molybdopterin molybdotransferase
MLSVDEVWSLIDQKVSAMPSERVSLQAASGRRLAEDIRADDDMPAFTRSAIDGFALPAGSRPGRYRVVAETKPGMTAAPPPADHEAVRIFTGSALPETGVELVMVEETTCEGGDVLVRMESSPRHLRRRASQARAGDVLLSEGGIVNSGAIALLATAGAATPLVGARVTAAHLGTGSELVEVSERPAPGFIRDSNSPLIASLLTEAGATLSFHDRVSEDVDQAVGALEKVRADVFLISGGASIGQYDGTPEVLNRLGFEIHSTKVRSRPGKPLIFATREGAVAFGLPGNPLSHFVCFHLFVRRAIDRLAGVAPRKMISVRLSGESPEPDLRETWWPALVRVEAATLLADPLPWRDSSDLGGLPPANALLRIGTGVTNGLVEALLFGNLA